MKSSAEFWDKVAVDYAAKPISNMPAYEMTMQETRKYLSPEDRVLELGCGSGSTALLLSPNVGHIWANDISAKLIEIGRSKAVEQQIDNVDFIEGDISQSEIDDNAPYDVLLAYNFIHLIKDIPSAVRRMHALIKPGGVFISKTGCLTGVRGLLRIPITIMQWLGKAPHVSFISPERLEAILKQEGFEILDSRTFPKAGESQFIVARKL